MADAAKQSLAVTHTRETVVLSAPHSLNRRCPLLTFFISTPFLRYPAKSVSAGASSPRSTPIQTGREEGGPLEMRHCVQLSKAICPSNREFAAYSERVDYKVPIHYPIAAVDTNPVSHSGCRLHPKCLSTSPHTGCRSTFLVGWNRCHRLPG